MGIGNFFGMLPEKMQESRLYGVELDGITGRIAKQLYPNADIKITGFEKTDYPNDFFDVAIGNVPFGQYKVTDKQYDKQNFLIHDYFFAKTLDKVRPGGVVAFVTSKGTMDKKSPEVRKYLAAHDPRPPGADRTRGQNRRRTARKCGPAQRSRRPPAQLLHGTHPLVPEFYAIFLVSMKFFSKSPCNFAKSVVG